MMPSQRAGEKDLFVGVNRSADPTNLSDLEKKHMPVIEAPRCVSKGEAYDVVVEVGSLLPHPNEPGHFIQSIELWADETYLTRIDLTAANTCPRVTVRVALHHASEVLRARIRCNLHGLWIGQKGIRVEL